MLAPRFTPPDAGPDGLQLPIPAETAGRLQLPVWKRGVLLTAQWNPPQPPPSPMSTPVRVSNE